MYHLLLLIAAFERVVLSQELSTSLDRCFGIYANVQLQCAFPFERRAQLSQLECQQLCINTYAASCHSLQYDIQQRQCDLYLLGALLQTQQQLQPPPQQSIYDQQQLQPPLQQSIYNQQQPQQPIFPSSFANIQEVDPTGAHRSNGYRRRKRSAQTSGYSFPNVLYAEDICEPSMRPSIGQLYMVPNGYCGQQNNGNNNRVIGQPPAAIPFSLDDQCANGRTLRFMQTDGIELVGVGNQLTLPADQLEACASVCATNTIVEGNQLGVNCRSVYWNSIHRQCFFSDQQIAPHGVNAYAANPESIYLEKFCLKDELLADCANAFIRAPQKILVGFARTVVNSTGLDDCLEQCITSQNRFGFQCKSGMIFYDYRLANCILNSETARSQAPMFAIERETKVDYFEIPPCYYTVKKLKQQSSSTSISSSSVNDQWSEWSECGMNTTTSGKRKQRRYRSCTAGNKTETTDGTKKPQCIWQSKRCGGADANEAEIGVVGGAMQTKRRRAPLSSSATIHLK